MIRRSAGSRSIQLPTDSKEYSSYKISQQISTEPVMSPGKIQSCYFKNLSKHQNHIQSNISKYKQRSYHTKPTEANSYVDYESKKSSFSLNLIEKINMLKSIERNYMMFKSVKSGEIGKEKKGIQKQEQNVKLQPISKTLEVKRTSSNMLAEQLNKFQHRRLKSRNEVLEDNGKNGNLSLRLILSNKIRNKIIKDLITTQHQQTKLNVKNILERDELEWLGEFEELRENVQMQKKEKRKRHNKKLVSRSNYNNAYYQFMALEKEQKEEYMKKARKKDIEKKVLNTKETQDVTKKEKLGSEVQKAVKSNKLRKYLDEESSDSEYLSP